jgi:hypothetical protein
MLEQLGDSRMSLREPRSGLFYLRHSADLREHMKILELGISFLLDKTRLDISYAQTRRYTFRILLRREGEFEVFTLAYDERYIVSQI